MGQEETEMPASRQQLAGLLSVLMFTVAICEAPGQIVNGDFETGDLTGWTVNSLVTPPSVPIGVTVDLVNGSLAADMSFSGNAAGNFAGSLLQDFTLTHAATVSFQTMLHLSSTVAANQSPGHQTIDVIGYDLDHHLSETFVHAESSRLGPYLIDVHQPIVAEVALSPGDYELLLLMHLSTVDGAETIGRLTLDNFALVPEPGSALLATFAFAGLVAWARRRSANPTHRHQARAVEASRV
jgi:hypothetical protein